MRLASQTGLNRTQTKKQVIAIAFLVCFIVVSLLSEVFILTHANHEHDHNGAYGTCATCAHIQNAENILKQLGTIVSGVSFAFAGLFIIFAVIRVICSDMDTLTPVTLKTRMNN